MIIYSFSNGTTKEILIPSDALRFRVIANSDTESDQQVKVKIKEVVDEYLNKILKDTNNKSDASTVVQKEINNIKQIVNEYHSNYEINFGKNFFPEKTFKGVKYAAGEYDSLVITLGEGKGENWWCVMYPPLCLMESEESYSEADYQFYIKNLLTKHQL